MAADNMEQNELGHYYDLDGKKNCEVLFFITKSEF